MIKTPKPVVKPIRTFTVDMLRTVRGGTYIDDDMHKVIGIRKWP